MSEFVIREAGDEDGPALAALLGAVWADYEGCVFEAGDHPSIERPATHFAERGGRLWIVTRDGEVAGSLGLVHHVRPREFELALICLDKASRGQGLATALLAGANAFAAASDGTRVTSWIDGRLVDGVRFLERQGFVREPGVRQRQDGSGALDAQFSKPVRADAPVAPSAAAEADPAAADEVSSPPSGAPPAGAA
jgi:putative acetyltransferase